MHYRLIWKGNLNDTYTAQDGHKWLNILEFVQNTIVNNSWKWVWHISALEKVTFFLLTILHKFLHMRLMLCHRGMLQTNICLIKTLRRLYTTLETLLLAFENLLTSWIHYSSLEIVYIIGLDMASMVTLSFWLLTGGFDALGTNRVLRMKWYRPILWNSSQLIMLIC